ncbi:MAG: LysR family transcriptional regulator [Lachnospiraceae bacterium]|nr:LysR family transcriptional regulator [Lachnospiraceae bacterium]
MLDLNELEQLITFAEMGTLSLAAEKLHISQPTITRTMQHLEEVFGVSLFERGKNKITLNDTGIKAVEQARQLLSAADNALRTVRAFDKSLHTITISSCAPAPLWYVLPSLSTAYPDMTIASSLKNVPAICEDLDSEFCQLAILPHNSQYNHYVNTPFLKENLSVCVPASHDLAKRSSVTFSELNGFNFLLKSEIGFWDEMCRVQMPASRFLVQTNLFEFEELVRESSLPCFTTNLAKDDQNLLTDRIQIPVTDSEANVTYYLVCHSQSIAYMNVLKRIDTNDIV